MNDRRLIEEDFPIREISAESVREKGIRQGNISTLHIWWARRPLVACRAAVLESLFRNPSSEDKRQELIDFIIKFCKWETSDEPKLIENARNLVTEMNGDKRPKVLDCFAGGGAIPLEALRVGCESYALELNPVAVVILLCTLVYPQKYGRPFEEIASDQRSLGLGKSRMNPNRLAHDVNRFGKWVFEEVQNEISAFYPLDSRRRVPLAYIWARSVTCPNPTCQCEVPLIRQLWLAKKPKRMIALHMVADKTNKRIVFDIVESNRALNFDPAKATMQSGSAECPICKSVIPRDYLKDQAISEKMRQRLIAVVCHSEEKGKEYRLPSKRDEEAFEKASRRLSTLLQTRTNGLSLLPDELISRDWPRTVLLPLYGITKWGQAFNPRQALSLVTFELKVRDVYDRLVKETADPDYAKAVATYIALVIDRMADYNSSITVWDNTQERSKNIFSRQAIPLAWDYAELNPLSHTVGSFEPMLGSIEKVILKLSQINSPPAKVTQGTATRLPYANGFFDAVITDPPYYNSVPYADLSDFFYVWLKRSVGFLYPDLFNTPLTPKGPEIVEQMPHSSLKNRKDKVFFEREMTRALVEMNRVLKPEGVCVVVFAHKTTTAWETLISALQSAGFSVTSSWPLHTEQRQRLRAHQSAVLASSVWLVCRKREVKAGVGAWKDVQVALDHRVKERLDYFLAEGIKGADALLSAIGPALEVFGRYERVEKVTGEVVTISDFLDKVREAIAHHALTTILSEQELGKLDAETAFYVLWKWTYETGIHPQKLEVKQRAQGVDENDAKVVNTNHLVVPYDDALKLARSVGAEPEILIKARKILEQEAESVRLLAPNERKGIHGLGETARDGTPPAVIDMIHRAVNLWAEQDRGKLQEYLKASGAETNETFWRVAQALSNLLPLQSREKQLLDGLLGSHQQGSYEASTPQGYVTLDKFSREETQA